MADRDQPRPSAPVTEDARVAAGGDDGVADAARLENLCAAVGGVAFADAAQVDAHSRVAEAYGVILLIEDQVAPVDRRQRRLDLRLVGTDVQRVVVEVADAR